jgi:outer membrane lipoprotein-sorting protein
MLTANELIEDIQQKAAIITTYKATWTSTNILEDQEVQAKGTLVFKKPKFMKITSFDSFGGKFIMVFDGENIWLYFPKEAVAYKEPQREEDIYKKHIFGEEWGVPSFPFKGKNKNMNYLYNKTIEGKDVYVLESITRNKDQEQASFLMPIKTNVFIRVKDGVIQKIISYDAKGKEIGRVAYKNILINIEIPDSEFAFNAPEGVKVMGGIGTADFYE